MKTDNKEDTIPPLNKLHWESNKRSTEEVLRKLAMIEKHDPWINRINILLLSLALTLAIITLRVIVLENGKHIDKMATQKDISSIILNGGDLRAIKQALENQPKVSALNLAFNPKEPYYSKDIALSYVLEDIRVEAFRANNTELLPKLEPIILEHEEVNPFDRLQVGQKDYFENLRIKTGSNYISISNDVNKLADELHQKNLLVDEYLSDSKMSFWISIFAVFLSLVIGGYQIFTGRPEALKKLLLSVSAELNGESDSNTKNPAEN